MANVINTDMTRLRREGRRYHMELKQARENSRLLCDHCGARGDCPMLRAIMIAPDWITLTVRECESFQPVIPFRSAEGLDAPKFNTVRLGRAWFDRVHEDKVVTMVTTGGAIIGSAIVRARFVGPLDLMLRRHAKNNHMLVNRNVEDPPAELMRSLINGYGTNFVKGDKQLSVIYLSPL